MLFYIQQYIANGIKPDLNFDAVIANFWYIKLFMKRVLNAVQFKNKNEIAKKKKEEELQRVYNN